MMRIFYFIFLFTVMAEPISANSLFQSHDEIRNTVNNFLQNNIQHSHDVETIIKIGKLDPRLKLTQCESDLTTFTSSNINQSGRFSVGVKCPGHKPWSLYVTVNIEKMTNLYITSTPLSRGDTITENNIVKVKRDINKLRRGFFSDKNQLIGMVAKRSIRTGTIIGNKHLTPPIIIKKGDTVDIIAKTSVIAIRMSGKAMTDGAKGQRIRVKNDSSRKIISAIVVTPGLVKVRF